MTEDNFIQIKKCLKYLCFEVGVASYRSKAGVPSLIMPRLQEEISHYLKAYEDYFPEEKKSDNNGN